MSTEDNNYYNDPRVRAGERRRRSPIRHVNMSRKVMVVTVYYGDEETQVDVPISFEVCPTCDGSGTHVNPSIDSNGLTAEDFAEDQDFAEEYMGGCYDVPCYECQGERVVPVIQRDRVDPKILALLDAQEERDEESRRTREAERRFGA